MIKFINIDRQQALELTINYRVQASYEKSLSFIVPIGLLFL
jgi:hypothetical protein